MAWTRLILCQLFIVKNESFMFSTYSPSDPSPAFADLISFSPDLTSLEFGRRPHFMSHVYCVEGEYTFFRSRWSFLDHWDPYSSVSVPRTEKCDCLSQWYWIQEYYFQRAKSKRNFAKEYLKENAFVIYCIRILAWRTTKVTQNFADVSSVSPSSERWRRANARTSSLQLFMVANFCYQLSW